VTLPGTVLLPTSLQESAPVRDLRGMICDVTARLSEERFGSDMIALVLTGSLARDEATFLRDSSGWTVAGDAEFLAIFGRGSRVPSRTDLDDVARTATSRLEARGMRCEVTLGGVRPAFLRRLPPTIFAYELRECGRVVTGDPMLLSLIPAFSEAEISREDAWRLLGNRIIEQLEVAGELADGARTLSPQAHYRTVKLYLDMATSLTVFAGIYRPTYRARTGMLRAAATAPSKTHWPFPLDDFLAEVIRCTEWKVAAAAVPAITVHAEFMRKAVGYAQQLWRWELAQLTGLDAGLPERKLLEAWMARQPRRARLRGWLFALREEGALRRQGWRRLASRARGPSPRYRVYEAATTLLFSLGEADGPTHPVWSQAWATVGRTLPVDGGASSSAGPEAWRCLAENILWNYHRFLTGTRA
jgi:hypothetical protein